MKTKFSTSWLGSKQVRKQRKYRHNAPLHLRRNFMSSNLSKELRKKFGKRSLVVRKGDEAIVMRGKFAKKKGKVLEVDLKKGRISIEGLNKKKSDGTKINVYFDASTLQLQSLNLEDAKRMKRFKGVKTEKREVKKIEEEKKETKSEKANDKKFDTKDKQEEKKHASNKSESK